MQKPYQINSDLYSAQNQYTSILYTKGDENVYRLTIRLLSKGEVFVIPENAAGYLNFARPDGTYEKAMLEIADAEKGVVAYNIAGTEISTEGKVVANVELHTDQKRLSWPSFTYMVANSADGNEQDPPEGYSVWTRDINAGIIGLNNRVSTLEKGKTASDCLDEVYIYGNLLDEWGGKNDERTARLSYRGNSLEFDTHIKLKPQGTSSLQYPKKNFTINFYGDQTFAAKNPIEMSPAWGAQSKYCAKANWIDPTHSRNIVSARLAAKMQEQYGLFPGTPNHGLIDGYPVVIYLNGVSQGLYTWNIPKDGWQFGMDKNNPNHILLAAESQTGSCAFTAEYTAANKGEWTVEFGPDDSETRAKFNRVVKFVKDADDESFRRDFEQYLNLDSTLNYWCFCYYSTALDNLGKNMLMATYDGDVWYPSLYDLDTTWGIWWPGTQTVSPFYKCPQQYECNTSLLWEKLQRCFPQEIANRFAELSRTVLNPACIVNETRRFIQGIDKRYFDETLQQWQGLSAMPYTLQTLQSNLSVRDGYSSFMLSNGTSKPLHNYGEVIYDLPQTFSGNGTDYIDTGVKLYSSNQRCFTLFLKGSLDIAASAASRYYLNCVSPGDATTGRYGLMVQRVSGTPTELLMRVGQFWETRHNYAANPNPDAPNTFTLVVRKITSGRYEFFCNGKKVYPESDSPVIQPHTAPLTIGCLLNSSGTPMLTSPTTTHQLRIYNGAMSDADVLDILKGF